MKKLSKTEADNLKDILKEIDLDGSGSVIVKLYQDPSTKIYYAYKAFFQEVLGGTLSVGAYFELEDNENLCWKDILEQIEVDEL